MMRFCRRLADSPAGAATVEFALVAPTFLMFLFLLLDGGRMLFAKQSLNEVATATARCAAIIATGCTDATSAQNWATARALARDNLNLSTAKVEIGVPCNTVANMAKATVTTTWKKGAMMLLPQSIAPSTLTAVACFPMAG
jgi:Flp pilus assembly protein TadG